MMVFCIVCQFFGYDFLKRSSTSLASWSFATASGAWCRRNVSRKPASTEGSFDGSSVIAYALIDFS
jgi:hypothetical protein